MPEDVDDLLALPVEPEIERAFGWDAGPRRARTEADARATIAEIDAGPDRCWWAIEHEGRFIGSVGLHQIVREERRAKLAIGILSPDHLGRGLGTEAMRLGIAHGFEVLRLHRVAARVLDFNARAVAAFRGSGFTEEGRERECALIGRHWHDDIIFGLLDIEYRRLAPDWPEFPYLSVARK